MAYGRYKRSYGRSSYGRSSYGRSSYGRGRSSFKAGYYRLRRMLSSMRYRPRKRFY